MDRLQMPGAMPADLAEVLSDAADFLTEADEKRIDKRADELMAEKIKDVESYKVFATDARSVTVDERVHLALMNLDRACEGEEIGRDAILAAMHQVQKIYKAWCEATYRDECRGEAEHEFYAGEL